MTALLPYLPGAIAVAVLLGLAAWTVVSGIRCLFRHAAGRRKARHARRPGGPRPDAVTTTATVPFARAGAFWPPVSCHQREVTA
jgi:hypothetical protein